VAGDIPEQAARYHIQAFVTLFRHMAGLGERSLNFVKELLTFHARVQEMK
jgi:hypothetical protein